MAYVDCDSHILPEDAFDEVPEELRKEGPRIETDSQGRSCVVYPARQRNIPDYARAIPNPFNPRPRSSGNKPDARIADMMGSWPNTVPAIKAREDLSWEAKQGILGQNALRLFGVAA